MSRKKVDLIIYNDCVQLYEPFNKLEFRAVKDTKNGDAFDVEWAVEGQHDYYALYAHSSKQGRWTCIADCDSKLKLMEIAQVLNVFAGYSLEVINNIQTANNS